MTPSDPKDETKLNYKPDWWIHPGEHLKEQLEEAQISQASLARLTSTSPKHINQIIQGKANIGFDFALELEVVFKVDASYWMNLVTNYELSVRRAALIRKSHERLKVLEAN